MSKARFYRQLCVSGCGNVHSLIIGGGALNEGVECVAPLLSAPLSRAISPCDRGVCGSHCNGGL